MLRYQSLPKNLVAELALLAIVLVFSARYATRVRLVSFTVNESSAEKEKTDKRIATFRGGFYFCLFGE